MVRFFATFLVALGATTVAHAQKQQNADQMLAGVLMRNGLLCSQVVDKRQAQGTSHVEVTCIEYREGTRRARYIVDLSTGKASKAQ